MSLTLANVNHFSIIANNKEINRPIFKQNNLIEKVSFITYSNLYHWYMNCKDTKYDTLSKL